MRVELAYPYDGHAPDETVELPTDVARSLISDGRARPAKPIPATSKPQDEEQASGEDIK